MNIPKKGIDVSKYQGKINYEALKASGNVDFIIIRAGIGKDDIDPQFVRNITECNRLGIPCGVYWFSYALTAADSAHEAQLCLNAIKPYRVEYPVCYDLEYDTARYAGEHGVTINKALATEMVKAFCNEIEKAGYKALNYSNLDYSRNMFDMKALSKYGLWYARYIDNCDRNDYDIWQYSDKGRIPGINANVDLNVCYKDYSNIKGDINSDGRVDSTDALMMKKSILGNINLSDEQKQRTDLNGDGKTDAIDMLIEKKKILNSVPH